MKRQAEGVRGKAFTGADGQNCNVESADAEQRVLAADPNALLATWRARHVCALRKGYGALPLYMPL
ncbi:MAG: hypothetical protein ABWY27_08475 [Telluria sp.]